MCECRQLRCPFWETYPEISDFAEGPLREFPSFSWIGTHRSTLTLKKQPTYIGCFFRKTATSYFPRQSPTKYHQR